MKRLTIATTMNTVIEFLDVQFIPQMAEAGAQRGVEGKLPGFKYAKWATVFAPEKFVKVTDDMLYYQESQPPRISLVILTKGTTPNKQLPRPLLLGMSIRQRTQDQLDVYVDLAESAVEKGILRPLIAAQELTTAKYVGYGLIALVVLASLIVIPLGWPLLLVGMVVMPFQYLKLKMQNKKKAREDKAAIDRVVTVFEKRFQVVSKAESQEYYDRWGNLKSQAIELIDPLS